MGIWGTSISLGQPVSLLLRDRAPLTLRLVGIGLLLSWAVAMALALSAAWLRVSAYDALTTVISGTFLCIPAAVLALLSVLWNVPGALAIGLIVFPRVYRYARNLLAKAYSLPHIITARAKGLSELRILFWHVVPVAGPQLLAVAGVSVSIAVGAAIPVEALCGLAGVGQLAWQAALARDLPLLTNLTILVTLVTLLANSGADVIGHDASRSGSMTLLRSNSRSSIWRGVACAILLLVIGVSLAANWLAPAGYAKQYREAAGAPPSRRALAGDR